MPKLNNQQIKLVMFGGGVLIGYLSFFAGIGIFVTMVVLDWKNIKS